MNRVSILIVSIIIAQPLTAATGDQRTQSYLEKTYQQVKSYVKEHPTAKAAALISMGIAASSLYYLLKPSQPLGEPHSPNDDRPAPRSRDGTHPRAPLDLAPAASAAVLGAETVVLHRQPATVDINARDGIGQTALIRAVLAGDRKAVKSLLKNPDVNIDAVDRFGRTALGYAAIHDHDRILLLLREEGANLIHRDADHETPLMYAACNDNLAAVKILLCDDAQDVHPDFASFSTLRLQKMRKLALSDIDAADSEGDTAFMLAVAHGHIDIMRFLLIQGASKEVIKSNGDNALMVAAFCDEEGAVLELLGAHMPVNAVSSDGDTALSIALEANSPRTTRALILAGADLTKLNPVQMRQALAHFEPYAREMMAARVAAQNQNDPFRSANGQFAPSVAVLAAVIGDTRTLHKMASTPEGRALLTIPDRATFEMTPLAAAIYTGQDAVVDLLLDTHYAHHDADLVNPRRSQPFAPRTDTQTPLIVAVRTGRMDLVRRLIAAGAHALDTYQGKTAADYCGNTDEFFLISKARSTDRANQNPTTVCRVVAKLAPLHLQAKVLQHLIYYRLGILIDVSSLQGNFSGKFDGLPSEALLDVAQGANRIHALHLFTRRLPLKLLMTLAKRLRQEIKNHSNLRHELQELEDSDLHKLDKRLLTLLARHVAHESGNREVELSTAEKKQAELFWKQCD